MYFFPFLSVPYGFSTIVIGWDMLRDVCLAH
jgi:hypothetical protein